MKEQTCRGWTGWVEGKRDERENFSLHNIRNK